MVRSWRRCRRTLPNDELRRPAVQRGPLAPTSHQPPHPTVAAFRLCAAPTSCRPPRLAGLLVYFFFFFSRDGSFSCLSYLLAASTGLAGADGLGSPSFRSRRLSSS